jgi:hypothetical protein
MANPYQIGIELAMATLSVKKCIVNFDIVVGCQFQFS